MRKAIQSIWGTLNQNIFVGDRYEKNLRNMAVTSSILIVMGFVMGLLNILQKQYLIALSPFAIFFASLISFIAVRRFGRRDVAVISTVIAVIFILTYDGLFADNGFAYLWTLLVPLAVCYMFSVKTGFLMTAYFELLFIVVFYTPVRRFIAPRYSKIVMTRFPLFYLFHGLLVLYIMYQYHKSVLIEIAYTDKLNQEVARQTAISEARSRKIEELSFRTIQTLAHAIDAKDPYTRGHSTRVSRYSVLVAEALGWDRERLNDLRYAALLHDIGKIGVPDSILNNPRRLTDVEYGIIKSHTTMGGDILRNGTLIATAEDVALSHHERYDGHGYPRGLAGKSISEEARIVAIADAFDAMSSNRVYRRACDRDHIRRELAEGRGKQFDPAYVDILVDLWDGGQLDDILRQDDDGDDGHEELSIDLLQQAMSSLARESADVDRLSTDMRVNLGYEGAMDVAYPEFTKLYEYIDNMGRRFDHPFALVMIALEANPGENPGSETLERAMYHMEQSVRQTIRSVDVITRYGERRFLVILSGTSREVVPTVMDRIFRGYYKMNGSGAFSPTYTVARER